MCPRGGKTLRLVKFQGSNVQKETLRSVELYDFDIKKIAKKEDR